MIVLFYVLIFLIVALITQLNSENVEDWTVIGWKISGKTVMIYHSDYCQCKPCQPCNWLQFLFIADGLGLINELFSGLLESPLLPWKPFYKDVGFCLRFSFQLPTRFDSSLEVYIKVLQGKILIWKLRGYQGNKWNSGTTTIRPQEEIQVSLLIYWLAFTKC